MKKIRLNQSKHTLVDDEDYWFLNQYKWYSYNNGYVFTNGSNNHKSYIHRIIMKAEKGQEVDHINRNKLDNRKSNLRFSNRHDQMRNAKYKVGISGYTGITKHGNHWQARIRIKGERIHLGCFKDPKEASNIYQNNLLI